MRPSIVLNTYGVVSSIIPNNPRNHQSAPEGAPPPPPPPHLSPPVGDAACRARGRCTRGYVQYIIHSLFKGSILMLSFWHAERVLKLRLPPLNTPIRSGDCIRQRAASPSRASRCRKQSQTPSDRGVVTYDSVTPAHAQKSHLSGANTY